MNTEQQILLAERERRNTSHILHLLITLVTFGWWLPIWLVVSIMNSSARGRLDAKIRAAGSDKVNQAERDGRM